jgi:orotate phosphoribosyltransferase
MTSQAKPPTLSQEEVFGIFEDKGALLTGHFRLSSGLHSDKYLQCALVLQHPDVAGRLGAAMADLFAEERPECVVGPAIGGIVIAQEVGRALGVRAMFSEREDDSMTLRRGFSVAKGERVLVVEDVITTGGSVQEAVDALVAMGADVVGVGAIIDRSGDRARFSVPFKSLARLEVGAFTEDECPLCRSGEPVYKPGSRKS